MANDAVRRIMAEVREFSVLNKSNTTFFWAQPLETDLFEWHFTVRGPPDTSFEHGVYHGRIVLPAEYPLKAPEIILLTPNGRFEVGKRICLSVTSYHQESWQPSWGIRTILTALVGFMPSKAEGVGALNYPDEDRKLLANRSHTFVCDRCGAKPTLQLPERKLKTQNCQKDVEKDKKEEEKIDLAGSSQQHAERNLNKNITESDQVNMEKNHEEKEQLKQLEEDNQAKENTQLEKNNQTEENKQLEEEIQSNEDHINQLQQSSRENDQLDTSNQNGQHRQQIPTQERELLFLAYGIIGLMFAVIARRILKTILGMDS